jgi:Flp pilus assembly pilin Flp
VFSKRLGCEEGQAVVEYALLGLFVSIVAVLVISQIGLSVSGMFGRVLTGFP